MDHNLRGNGMGLTCNTTEVPRVRVVFRAPSGANALTVLSLSTFSSVSQCYEQKEHIKVILNHY